MTKLVTIRWLPIRHPDFKDLPPTMQLAIARMQAAHQAQQIAAQEAQ